MCIRTQPTCLLTAATQLIIGQMVRSSLLSLREDVVSFILQTIARCSNLHEHQMKRYSFDSCYRQPWPCLPNESKVPGQPAKQWGIPCHLLSAYSVIRLFWARMILPALVSPLSASSLLPSKPYSQDTHNNCDC